jgi:DNA modification methylase
MGNLLYCGDNLEVLRRCVPSGSVGVVYLDPPFNSGKDWYMKPPAGGRGQVLAFTDTWPWTPDAAQAYEQLTAAGGVQGAVLEWLRGILGERAGLAYLCHMAPRLTELHRVLRPDGGIFLHCDTSMSHYLQILLDAMFGERNLAARIVWKRTSAHSNAKGFARVHDTILAYRRGGTAAWCHPDGSMNLNGHGDVWADIPPVNGSARERLGYPTQKPLPLLTRILTLAAAGGPLLDPNCGSGTSIEAAHQLGLGWTGIDLTQAAINLAQGRLRAAGADFEVRGADAA